MIRIEVKPKEGEAILHLDGEGIDRLIAMAEEIRPGFKGFMGDPGAMLVLRHVDYNGPEEQGVGPHKEIDLGGNG